MAELNVKLKPNQKLVWSTITIISLMHMASFYVFYYRIVYGLKLHWYQLVAVATTSLGITAGYHRLWCHKSYKANAAMQTILLIFASSTYQKSCYHWVRDHRTHHMYSETDADPHNANRGLIPRHFTRALRLSYITLETVALMSDELQATISRVIHMGWLFVRKHPDVTEKGKLVDMSDLKANPLVMFQHKYYYYIVMLFALIIPTYCGYLIGHPLYVALLLSLHRVLIGMHVTWGVNSFAHLYGIKPYTKALGPTENLFVVATTGGEGFHNYHHTFPQDYKANFKHGDFKSPATLFIDLCELLGMASNLKVVPDKTVRLWAKKFGNLSQLDEMNTLTNNLKDICISVITHIIFL